MCGLACVEIMRSGFFKSDHFRVRVLQILIFHFSYPCTKINFSVHSTERELKSLISAIFPVFAVIFIDGYEHHNVGFV